jgi:hypothetical protein
VADGVGTDRGDNQIGGINRLIPAQGDGRVSHCPQQCEQQPKESGKRFFQFMIYDL